MQKQYKKINVSLLDNRLPEFTKDLVFNYWTIQSHLLLFVLIASDPKLKQRISNDWE